MTSSYWFQGEAAPGPDQGDPIGQSLRFRKGPWLEQPTPGLGNRRTFTVSFWTKLGTEQGGSSSYQIFQSGASSGNPVSGMQWMPSPNWGDYLRVDSYAGSNIVNLQTTAAFRDSSAWYHIVYAVDTTRDNDVDRLRIYVNGVNQPLTGTYPSKDYQMEFNDQGAGKVFTIGANTTSNGTYEGYIADFYSIDGQALLPTAFGRYNREGVWVPVKPDFSKTTGTEKYSSYLTVSNGSQYGDSSLAFNGDLDPTGSGSGRVYTDVGATLTWAPEPAFAFTTSLEVYNTNSAGQNEASWDGNSAGANGGWITVYSGSGEVSEDKPLVVQGLSGRAEIHAIRIDGELVNDPYIWSSELYWDAQDPAVNDAAQPVDWNTTVKYDDNRPASNPGSRAFDGNLDTDIYANGPNGCIIWKPNTPIVANQSIRCRITNGAGGTFQRFYVNETYTGQYQTNDEWIDMVGGVISFPITIQSLGFKGYSGGYAGWVSAIEIDGKVLVDGSNPYFGPNGFHLDFSDPNDLGADRSGNGNNFTANGFNTLPIGDWSSQTYRNPASGPLGNPIPAQYLDVESVVTDRTFSEGPESGFNGSSGGAVLANSGYVVFRPTVPIENVTSIVCHQYSGQGNSLNGVDLGNTTGSSGTETERIYDGPPITLETWGAFHRTGNPPNGGWWQLSVGINGGDPEILVDRTWRDYDLVLDTPTQNYSTWQSYLPAGTLPLTSANLTTDGDGTWRSTASQFRLTSGQWMWETTRNDAGGYVGILSETFNTNPTYDGQDGYPAYSVQLDMSDFTGKAVVYVANTATPGSYSSTDYGTTSCAQGSVVRTRLDIDNTRIAFDIDGVEGAWLDYSQWLDDYPIIPTNSNLQFYNVSINYGQQPFLYPDANYKAIQTQNLPVAPIADGGEHFRCITADGDEILSVAKGLANGDNGTGFQRGLWWIKQRTNGNHQLLDPIRGDRNIINSDTPGVETSYSIPSGQCVAWCWKAGDSIQFNNEGGIPSTVCANPDAGFSIVRYAGIAGQDSVGHGLNKAPEMIFVKQLDAATRWVTYHEPNGIDSFLSLNTAESSASNNVSNYWGQGMTDTTFGVYAAGGNNNTDGSDTIAYCWHSVPGYSKFGSYVGNGDVKGPVINCGFTPAYVLVKNMTTGNNSWIINDAVRDVSNPMNNEMYADTTSADTTYNRCDFLSNGFRAINNDVSSNADGQRYVYAAFASHPQGASKLAPATAGFLGPVEYEGVSAKLNGSSLRFKDPNSHLETFQIKSGNSRTWTYSTWLKLPKTPTSGDYNLISAAVAEHASNPSITYINYDPDGRFVAFNIRNNDFGNRFQVKTTGQYRDPNAWYHLMVSVDTTQAVAEDRVKIFVNGVETVPHPDSFFGPQNAETYFNTTAETSIGREAVRNRYVFEGFMAETQFVDGTQVVQPTEFGQFNSYGTWEPKETDIPDYGNSGWHLKFDPAYTFFESIDYLRDQSGNNYKFALVDFEIDNYYSFELDWMSDSPSNNIATYNPLVWTSNGGAGPAPIIKNANLTVDMGNSLNGVNASIGMPPNTGTYYWEVEQYQNNTGNGTIALTRGKSDSSWGADGNGFYFSESINQIQEDPDGVQSNVIANPNNQAGDVYMVCYKSDIGQLWMGKNGNWFQRNGDVGPGVPNSNYLPFASTSRELTDGVTYYPGHFGSGGGGTFYSSNFGQKPFKYDLPVGARGLLAKNVPADILDGKDHFGVITYTGNSSTQAITGLEFQPDFVWIKGRSLSSWHMLFDSIRGTDRQLFSNVSNAEQTETSFLTSFDSNGFTLGPSNSGDGSTNNNGSEYVAWCWKAGGAAVTNNDGSLQSQVSANTTAGFSIVSYTGDGTNSAATVGHGLDKAPELMILAFRDSAGRKSVYNEAVGNTYRLSLNTNETADSSVQHWNNTSPTDTVFTVGNNFNQGQVFDYIVYCWHSVPGFSKVGVFKGQGLGDGSTFNGSFVDCGFRPAFVMTKDIDVAGTNWIIKDTTRVVTNPDRTRLQPNEADAEQTSSEVGMYEVDLLSSGFKVRDQSGDISQGNIAYIAFAENPFSISNAR